MRVLLDECVPHPLRKLLPEHQVATVRESGWNGKKNGELLQIAEQQVDAFITSDRNLRYQQNLVGRKIGIVELPTPDGNVLKHMGPAIAAALESLGSKNNYIEIQLPEI
jgi:predicted nuclease of predicted toxin-antitoxin system